MQTRPPRPIRHRSRARTAPFAAAAFAYLGVAYLGVACLAVATAQGEPGESKRARFYDFSGMTITPDSHAPGVTLIFGDQVGRSRCQHDDPDEFRLCIGEIRDQFEAVPKDSAAPIDLALVVVGPQAAASLAGGASHLAQAHTDGWVDLRGTLFPPPHQIPGAPKEAYELSRHWDSATWKGGAGEISRAASLLRRIVAYPSGLSYLNAAVMSSALERDPFRPEARLLVLVVASGEDRWGGAAELVRALDRTKGKGRWAAHVLCLQTDCSSFAPLVSGASGSVQQVVPKALGPAMFQALRDASRQANRWTLSHNPITSGYMEVRVGREAVAPSQFSYDPFERRVRVSDSLLDADAATEVQVWYFPFHPSQVLAEVCPAAVQRRATGTAADTARESPDERHDGALPCRGWMADELAAPEPSPIIDLVFDGVDPSHTRGAGYGAGVSALKGPFQARDIDFAVRVLPPRPQWRADAFKILVVPRGKSSPFASTADAVLEWDGRWRADELETLAWRAMSRTIRIPITGMPIRFDSLKVFLNGRAIEPTTRDGAGYVLKGGYLYLDVAAPLHRDSHIFAVYRHDVKGRRR